MYNTERLFAIVVKIIIFMLAVILAIKWGGKNK